MSAIIKSLPRGGDRGEWIDQVLSGAFDSILDIGCSRGWTLALLQKKAGRLVGIDMDQRALAEARAAYPPIEFIEQTAITLPFPSENFDVVILSEVIEHVGNINKQTVIDEAHRVLKRGGIFVFTAPYAGALAWLDPMDFKRRFPMFYRTYMRWTRYVPETSIEIGHEHVSDEEIRSLFADRFEITTIEYCGLFMPFFTWVLAIDNRLQWLPHRWHQWFKSPPRLGERCTLPARPRFQRPTGRTQEMKLAFTHVDLPNESRGGVAYQVHYLANEMVKRGHTVTMFTFSPTYGDCSYAVHQFTLPAWAKRFHAFFLAWRLKQSNFSGFDILHTFGDNYLISGQQPPHVRTFSGSARDEAASARTWKRRLYQWITIWLEHWGAARADFCVGISEATRKQIPAIQLVIPCGVDLRCFSPGAKSKNPSVLFVGTAQGRKRGQFLATIFEKEVLSRCPHAELWAVSDRPLEAAGVRNFGKVALEDLIELFQTAWAFCLPSTYEGFGVPYIEALAAGTPVVATKNLGACEVLRNEEYGMITSDADLGQTLSRLLADAPLREEMARKGTQRALDYDWPQIALQYEELYSRLATNRVMPAAGG